ncbi:MAG: FAD-binding oxidoreductase, partial [Rhodothermales bacterium]|nr:FAD-binding oxidoreductase [Rhodothermales bacterium]
SKGLLDEARQRARAAVEVLAPLAAEGLPIVGLEPSCVLTLRDEFLALLPGDAQAEAVAAAAQTFEAFVAAHAERFRALPWREAGRRVLLHGHCHQKALDGIAPSAGCLEAAGFAVEAVDGGCCGMAGSFGYEAEHYAVSVAMGERVLAPAVRAAPEAAVAAAGTSCRHQVADLTGRAAQHPAVLLAEALGGDGPGA